MAEDWKRRSDLKSWAISRTWIGRHVSHLSQCWEQVSSRSRSAGNATYQALEGELADEQLSRLLVATDLTESDGTGLVAVRLLDTTGRRGGLAGGLGGELLAGSLATSGLTGAVGGKTR